MPLRHAIRHLQASVVKRQRYNRGQYSIERLCALKHYTDRTSAIRVLLISVLTIALSLLTILALDVIPLQDPNSGWQKNYSMWIRVFTGSFALSIGVMFQLQKLAPEAHLTLWKGVRVAFFTSVGNCVASIAIASSWVFPVPFLAILTMPIWLILFCSGILITVGLDNWRQNPELVTQVKRYAIKLYIESNLLLIYPAYNVVYNKLTGIGQFAFIFVLPVMKYALKKIMKGVVEDLEDLVPVVVITVDLFNALYQSKCMQSSGSMLTTAGIIVIDAIQNVHALRQLFEYMRDVENLTNDEIYAQGVLTYALKLMDEPQQLDSKELLRIRVSSTCASMALSKEQGEMLQRMQTIQEQTVNEGSDGRADDGSQDSSRKTQSRSEKSGSSSYNAVIPWTDKPSAQPAKKGKPYSEFSVRSTKIMPSIAVKSVRSPSTELTRKEKATILTKTLELLWKCERLLLVEYVESAIPLLYALYLTILSQLTNAKYYPGVSEMSPETLDRVIMSILIYGFLEFLSLLSVHTILRWKFRISPLHQLAFSLENEWLIIQGMLLAWVVVILQFTLVHYGIDFTFQFDWIAKNRVE